VKLNSKIFLLLCFGFIFKNYTSNGIFGQSATDLESKKIENIEKLNYSKSLLEKTAQSKITTLNQLTIIQQNILLRTNIVDNISDELSFLKNDIEQNNIEIKRIEFKIIKIKKDYAELIIVASRNLDNDYAMMYIFSSEDFNQAYQRIKYLKYIAKYRMDLVSKLITEEENLKEKNQSLISNMKKNERLLVERKRELSDLDSDKKQNLNLIKLLQNQESELKNEIQKRERIQAEIEKEIKRIIDEEAAKARLSKRENSLTVEEKIISIDFSKNMGRLPWPSEKGVVTGKYGEQNHPVLKGIKVRSNGIDINTVEGAKVRSVFDGEITKVIAILGANYTVIIKHGDFRTVYQNLIDVRVKAGDKIKTKEVIGTVFTDKDNFTRLHFEIWKEKDTQNPEQWLAK
jgi:septal ring factor EnvC (AmiA/AmiB activator)